MSMRGGEGVGSRKLKKGDSQRGEVKGPNCISATLIGREELLPDDMMGGLPSSIMFLKGVFRKGSMLGLLMLQKTLYEIRR